MTVTIQPTDKEQSEKLLAVADLITLVNKMVRESGDPTGFDAGKWLSGWLTSPNPALGGVPPGDYMDTGEGRSMVADLLAKMQSGAYS